MRDDGEQSGTETDKDVPGSASDRLHSAIKWIFRIAVGLFFAICGLFCGAVSIALTFSPPPGAQQPIASIIALAMIFLSLWVLTIALRLIFNQPTHGGLLSPTSLRVIAVLQIAFPVFLIITGHAQHWPVARALQAIAYIFGGCGLWALAAYRKASNIRM